MFKSHYVLLCGFSDLLAVPKHPYAAMENWGLSVFVEQKILLDAEVSSSSYQMELTMVVVHEICHQVGNLNFNQQLLQLGFKYLTSTVAQVLFYPVKVQSFLFFLIFFGARGFRFHY